MFAAYSDARFQNIHCIGDRANKEVLDILEAQLSLKDADGNLKYDVVEARPRVEHAQIFEKHDLKERIGRLGSEFLERLQPTHF